MNWLGLPILEAGELHFDVEALNPGDPSAESLLVVCGQTPTVPQGLVWRADLRALGPSAPSGEATVVEVAVGTRAMIELDKPAPVALVAHWQGGTCAEPLPKTWTLPGDDAETLVLGTLSPSETRLERLFGLDPDYCDAVAHPGVFWDDAVPQSLPDADPGAIHHIKLTSEDEPGVALACGDVDLNDGVWQGPERAMDEPAATAPVSDCGHVPAAKPPTSGSAVMGVARCGSVATPGEEKKRLTAPGVPEPVTEGLPADVRLPTIVQNFIPYDEVYKGKAGPLTLHDLPPGVYTIWELEDLGVDTRQYWDTHGLPGCPVPTAENHAREASLTAEQSLREGRLAEKCNWICKVLPSNPGWGVSVGEHLPDTGVPLTPPVPIEGGE